MPWGEGSRQQCATMSSSRRKARASDFRRRNPFQSVLRVRHRIHPVSYEELIEISHIWVDAAMQLGERDIRLMERLLKAQDKMVGTLTVRGGVGQAKF